MTALSAQASGRRAAEALMVDLCEVRAAGARVFDPDTGEYTDTAGPVVYSGMCRVRVPQAVPQSAVAGEAMWSLTSAVVSVPLDVVAVEAGHTVLVVAASVDPGLEGRTYRVEAVEAATYPTARRLRCEMVQ